MLTFLARIYAKGRYIWKETVEAAMNEIGAQLSAQNAAEKRTIIAQLTKEADDIDANIKRMAEKEEKGYLECENGHEITDAGVIHGEVGGRPFDGVPTQCPQCFAAFKVIKRSEMTGKEQYESDQQRKDAEKIAESKRQYAKQLEGEVSDHEKTVAYFQKIVQTHRDMARNIRRLK